MMVTPAKLLFLILWVGSILLIILFLLIVEYLKDHLERRRSLLLMSPEELIDVMKDCGGEGEKA